ncbi:hypothetical protein O7599_16290 [Streptomyces sp. WMMC500]|uniref:YDG/SRA domain-containing protein n=1 Tax=Streptomyces sp. WMMC500 TaxID=3015154 RepID=UPI00248D1E1F|nr:YDG/SRA domain-containing protein [Streptomyces sp. WMMC500]WBB63975.1 hypothetical protein O7599_16290 [Streptomyces sp. WMMC500]
MSRESKGPYFGAPSGVEVGDWFKGHRELYEAGVHRGLGQGISGGATHGVDSIVLSGGYTDDRLTDEEIIYTGKGGRDEATRRQVADQSMATPGNAGLFLSYVMDYPIRVIQGLDIRHGKATGGYLYRGLWHVIDAWSTTGVDGFRIYQFQLKEIRAAAERSSAGPQEAPGYLEITRRVRKLLEQRRIVHDSQTADMVKKQNDHTCQVCRTRLTVSPDGTPYSEAVHIHEVGEPHRGPDKPENMLCLCPNCRVKFERGALHLTDSFQVVNSLTGSIISNLRQTEGHRIGIEYVRHHRARWVPEQTTSTGA